MVLVIVGPEHGEAALDAGQELHLTGVGRLTGGRSEQSVNDHRALFVHLLTLIAPLQEVTQRVSDEADI